MAASLWEAAWSPTERRWFYQDRVAGIAVWQRPPGCTIQLPVDPPAEELRGGQPAKDLPKDWERAWDASSSRHFYFNRSTGVRSWHPPKLQSGMWEVVWSKPHQRWFYCNSLSGVLVEERPPGCPLNLPTEPMREKVKSHEEALQDDILAALNGVRHTQEVGQTPMLPHIQHRLQSARGRTPLLGGEVELYEVGHEPPAVPLREAAAMRRRPGSRSQTPSMADGVSLPGVAALPQARTRQQAPGTENLNGGLKNYFQRTPFQPASYALDPVAAPEMSRPYKPGDKVSMWSPARGEWMDAVVVIAAPMAPPEQVVIVEFDTVEGKCRRELTAGHENLRPNVRVSREPPRALSKDCGWLPPAELRMSACPRGSRCPLRSAAHLASEAHPFDAEYASVCQKVGLQAEERSLRSLYAWLDDTGRAMEVTREGLERAVPLLSWLYSEHKNPSAPWESIPGDDRGGLLQLGTADWRQLDPKGTGIIAFEPFSEWAAPLLGLPVRAPPWGFKAYLPGHEPPPEPAKQASQPASAGEASGAPALAKASRVPSKPTAVSKKQERRNARKRRREIAQQQAKELITQGRAEEAMDVLAKDLADDEAEDDADEAEQEEQEQRVPSKGGSKRPESKAMRQARRRRREVAQTQVRELIAQGRGEEAMQFLSERMADIQAEEDAEASEEEDLQDSQIRRYGRRRRREAAHQQVKELLSQGRGQEAMDAFAEHMADIEAAEDADGAEDQDDRQRGRRVARRRKREVAEQQARELIAQGRGEEAMDVLAKLMAELRADEDQEERLSSPEQKPAPLAGRAGPSAGDLQMQEAERRLMALQQAVIDRRDPSSQKVVPPLARPLSEPPGAASTSKFTASLSSRLPVQQPSLQSADLLSEVSRELGIPMTALKSGQVGIPVQDFHPDFSSKTNSARTSRLPSPSASRTASKETAPTQSANLAMTLSPQKSEAPRRPSARKVASEAGVPVKALKSGQLGIPLQDFIPESAPASFAGSAPSSQLASPDGSRRGTKEPPTSSRAATPRLQPPSSQRHQGSSSRRVSSSSSRRSRPPSQDGRERQLSPTWEMQLRSQEAQWFRSMQEKQKRWEQDQQRQQSKASVGQQSARSARI